MKPSTEMGHFKKHLDDAIADDDAGMLTNPVCLYYHLMELTPHFESASAFTYFRSPEARTASSIARNLIDCGREWVRELTEVDLGRILFAAIALGGSTLKLYRDCFAEIEQKKQELV